MRARFARRTRPHSRFLAAAVGRDRCRARDDPGHDDHGRFRCARVFRRERRDARKIRVVARKNDAPDGERTRSGRNKTLRRRSDGGRAEASRLIVGLSSRSEIYPRRNRRQFASGRFWNAALLDRKFDPVAGVQFGYVIGRYDTQLENMFARLDAVERAFFAFEHSH